MFTGIINHLGKLIKKEEAKFTFSASSAFCKRIVSGTSISVNGTCLTAFEKPNQISFSVEIMPETLKKTIFGQINIGDLVNLELPATPNSFLSGHIVQGHIDKVVKLLDIKLTQNSRILKFSSISYLTRYIVEKGSISVNGISLTVIEAEKKYFTVGIIPYTWNNTMLKTIKIGDFVNIETDILAKYIERLAKNA